MPDLHSTYTLNTSTLINHIFQRIRSKFGHHTPTSPHYAELSVPYPVNRSHFDTTTRGIAAIIRQVRKADLELIAYQKFPFDVLQGLIRAAVLGDEECQELALEIHEDCMRRLNSYTLKERRQIRLGYMMLDLYSLAYTNFTSWDVVDGIRKHFFYTSTDGPRLDDQVFVSFIHHAVRTGNLPRSSANQILLLLTACDSDPESEVEKAVFEDHELFGPNGYIYTNDGRVVDRPQDISLYDEIVHEEDLFDAPETASQFHRHLHSFAAGIEEYVAGDRRSGAFGSEMGDGRSEQSSTEQTDWSHKSSSGTQGAPSSSLTLAEFHTLEARGSLFKRLQRRIETTYQRLQRQVPQPSSQREE